MTTENIRTAIISELSKYFKQNNIQDDIISIEEAAKLLNIPKRAIKNEIVTGLGIAEVVNDVIIPKNSGYNPNTDTKNGIDLTCYTDEAALEIRFWYNDYFIRIYFRDLIQSPRELYEYGTYYFFKNNLKKAFCEGHAIDYFS